MAAIELRGLSKSFGSVEVLRSLDLDVAEGEFIALVGPSGCGKSTLLRIIAGLEEASAGDVVMDGEVVNDLNPRERNVAMVFQSYALYPHMSVEENIAFNLRISGVPKAERRERAREVAGMLGLTPLLDRKPSQLSGGQRQRVAMGRALVRDPDLFLFDEPLSNLDAKLRGEMRDEIKRLHGTVRTTSIYVTHDQIEAMTLADRIVILDRGVIQQIGTPSDLYARPANAFVAGFIGSPPMNFLAGTLVRSGEGAVLQTEGQAVPIPPAAVGGAPMGPVKIGLRPEHLRVVAPGSEGITFEGELHLIEPTGAQNHLKVEVGSRLLTVVESSDRQRTLGEPITLAIAPEQMMLWPADG